MSILNIIFEMPWWYNTIIILFSLYYGIRGVMEKRIHYGENYNQVQKIIILDIQEFLFKAIFTVSGFMALFIANYIFSSLKSYNDIGTGTAILLIFLFIWGIAGVSGYLTFLILSGKFPTQK